MIKFIGKIGRKEVNELYGRARAGIVIYQPAANHMESQPIKMYGLSQYLVLLFVQPIKQHMVPILDVATISRIIPTRVFSTHMGEELSFSS